MTDNNIKIGISGGTFDPIHYGHLILAEAVRDAFNLDMVLFIPAGKPPHKRDDNVTSPEHRFGMVECAVSSNPQFKASRLEIDRTGYTYTIDTLRSLKEIYGENAGLFFITGADIIWDLEKWKDFKQVFSLCDFITALRPGYNKTEFDERRKYLEEKYGARIHSAEIPLIEISSTMIREKVKNKRSIRYLVPECVEEYIDKNGLYCEITKRREI